MKTAMQQLLEFLETNAKDIQPMDIDDIIRLIEAEYIEKEKSQIVDSIVCYFQVNDKTPYGMEYLSKLDNAIGDAVDFYNKTYTEEKSKSFTDGINDFKEKHGAIFENKSYEELKNNFITVGKVLEDYIEESGYGMDMWSKEENDTMSKIIQILKQNKIIQDENN